jgi:nitroimidazol reductase NimA-like FMN-containing flavoprotein (pyridoxamine 5'-phosphate oxidase superfamily)
MTGGALFEPTDRTQLRRKRERGSYDRELVLSVLDEGLVAHVGFVATHGVVVLPMAYARVDDRLYLHGATGNHMLRTLANGQPACVTVTILDGLVLARSAFKHSMNYRSVVVFGSFEPVTDDEEARTGAAALLDHMAPGRSRDARPPSDTELRRTTILRLSIAEASAKVRSGGPIDEPDDLPLPIWAGQVPLQLRADEPIADVDLPAPDYLTRIAVPR